MTSEITANSGSFRDPENRVYEINSEGHDNRLRILRGISGDALGIFKMLCEEDFYRELQDGGAVVKTDLLPADDADAKHILNDGWAGVLEHEPVPFVTYPYEWTFTMLKDAALLQLSLIEKCLENGWTLKDATPYNIQWIGARPVFIDIVSFEPWTEGEPWVGYRQFCTMFLTPLLLRAHLGIDQIPLLRSYIDGIPPTEAIKFFTGLKRLKRAFSAISIFRQRSRIRLPNANGTTRPLKSESRAGKPRRCCLASFKAFTGR